jgi:hypothetical protein
VIRRELQKYRKIKVICYLRTQWPDSALVLNFRGVPEINSEWSYKSQSKDEATEASEIKFKI